MEHNRTFMPWFKDEVLKDSTASETLTWLVVGLKYDVISCKAYEVNNCIFYTKSMDEKSTVQNSGVTLEAELMQFSTLKDTNPILGSMAYYGFIEEIWEVEYTKFIVPVFKCKWVENKSGVKIDELEFTLVDFRKTGYPDEPFIMVQQASQVFYVQDPTSEHWYVGLHGKKQGEAIDDIENGDPRSFTPMTINKDDNVLDDVHVTRKDHSEGIYI